MDKILKPCTVVPENLYVERDADRQICQIIDGMGRPGYVLVARQMGKTNLLLHTRKKMESSKVVFTFIDFSTIGGYTETECFNHLIDETICLHKDIFSVAETEIDCLRQKTNYSGFKMFTRELRILLKYVDKLVFILDEIDALARTEYSDRVFSTIRSHYFQRENYCELNKLTYILSGVIEPKDIIKDPNISPFNIGEKIYMNDFSYEEYESFIEKTGITLLQHDTIKNRIYYWTNGNPRLTWDICALVEELNIKSEKELDDTIRKFYLTAFDKAPIDAIRQRVQDEEILKDALIQLYFNKGESLSTDVKNQLYLAGITNFDINLPQIKSPILKECLGYDWLMSLKSKKLDYLTEADHAIWMNNDYKKAINYLNHYIEEYHTDEDIDKAFYLLGVAHNRSFNLENAVLYLDRVKSRGPQSRYYYQAILELAYVYVSFEKYELALDCFNQIKRDDVSNDEFWIKSQIGKVGLLIKTEDNDNLNEAEQILIKIVQEQIIEATIPNMLSLCQYYLSCIYELRHSISNAIKCLDSALNVAQQNERQVLLYKKLSIVNESDKSLVAEELYQSLSSETKPQTEDIDNPLAFNLVIACQILACLILKYPKYDVNIYLRKFLIGSKENAVIYIDTVLHQTGDELASPFFTYIKTLLTNEDWHFEDEDKANIALLDWERNSDRTMAIEYATSLSSNPIHDVSLKGANVLLKLTQTSISENKMDEAYRYYHLFSDNVTNYRGVTQGQRILFDYYYSAVLYKKNPFYFSDFSAELLNRATEYRNKYNENKGDRLKLEDINNIIKNVKGWRLEFYKILHKQLKTDTEKNDIVNNKLGRNSIVRVVYRTNNEIKEGKYKNYKEDIEKKICFVDKIIKN